MTPDQFKKEIAVKFEELVEVSCGNNEKTLAYMLSQTINLLEEAKREFKDADS